MIDIIITAYKTQDYIIECLESIKKQKGVNRILLGIDGCKSTLNAIRDSINDYPGLEVYMFNKNNGWTITFNTLYTLSSSDYVMRFDSDDIMRDDMVIKTVEAFQRYECDMVRYRGQNFNNEKRLNVQNMHGVFAFKRSVFDHLGGFAAWRTSADTDFHLRCKDCKFKSVTLTDTMFDRRIWGGSLTQHPDTAMGSEYRNKIREGLRYSYIKESMTISNDYYKVENGKK